jgi:hypothetical protein
MHGFLKKYQVYLLAIPLGLLAGFLYWRFVGCNSGSCAITSNWYSSAFFGGLLGYLLGDSIKDILQRKAKST